MWGDAIQWAAYTKNRIPHKTLRKSPIEALIGKGDRSGLRPFGQKVMIHLYKEERNNDRMTPSAIEARIIGYMATYGVYQVITATGKRRIAKNPRPILNQEDSDEEHTSEWHIKPVEDLEDIANGQPGRNYGWYCPEKTGCPEGSHKGNQPQTSEKPKLTETPPDSSSQQLFREQQPEPPLAPQNHLPPNLDDLKECNEMSLIGKTESNKD